MVYYFMEEAKQGSENETHDENTAPHPTISLYQRFLFFFFFKLMSCVWKYPLVYLVHILEIYRDKS